MNQTSNMATALEGQESNRVISEFNSTKPCLDKGQEGVQNACSELAGLAATDAQGRTASRRRWLWVSAVILLLSVLGWLFFFSLRLAGTRIFQIDEFNEVYVAHVLGSGAGTATP